MKNVKRILAGHWPIVSHEIHHCQIAHQNVSDVVNRVVEQRLQRGEEKIRGEREIGEE